VLADVFIVNGGPRL